MGKTANSSAGKQNTEADKRPKRRPSPIVDLPGKHREAATTGTVIKIPPPTIQVIEVKIETSGSIRIKLSAAIPGDRAMSAHGSTLSATVIAAGKPFAGTLEEQQIADLLARLANSTEADAVIALHGPEGELAPADLGSTYEMVQVAGEILCLETDHGEHSYVGTHNVMVTGYRQQGSPPTVHSSLHGRA